MNHPTLSFLIPVPSFPLPLFLPSFPLSPNRRHVDGFFLYRLNSEAVLDGFRLLEKYSYI
jgi:hypothetical protein